METSTIDRLFLELSQFTQASSAKEIELRSQVNQLLAAIKPFAVAVKTTSGAIPYDKLSLVNWHDLVKAYNVCNKNNTDN